MPIGPAGTVPHWQELDGVTLQGTILDSAEDKNVLERQSTS